MKTLLSNEEYAKAESAKKAEIAANILPTVYIKVPSVNTAQYKRVCAFVDIFKGPVPLVIYDEETGKRYKSSNIGIIADDFTIKELKAIVGENSVVLK